MTTVAVLGGEYRSRTDDLPEANSGRSSPYLAKTLISICNERFYFKRNKK